MRQMNRPKDPLRGAQRYLPVIVLPLVLLGFLAGCAQRSEPAPVDSVYQGRTVHDFSRGSLSDQAYQVQRGDTLYSIAFRAEMDLRDIARLNNLSEPYNIHPGQVLRLVADAPIQPVATANTVQSSSINRQKSVNDRKDASETDLSRGIVSNSEQEYGKNRTDQESSQQKSVRPAQQATTPAATRSETARSTSSSEGPIEWQWPSQGRIIRRFSNDRPGASGIIFSGSKGDPVAAAAAGKVVYVGSALRGFGRLIILKHNDDFITAYAHNETLMVQDQEWVAAGQQIATMGDSDADDIRLRFELRYQGSSVNPEQYLPRSR